jgi:hypothetical protein
MMGAFHFVRDIFTQIGRSQKMLLHETGETPTEVPPLKPIEDA